MKPYDPTKPVSLTNWPRGLKMPPLRRQQPEKPAKPVPVSSSREPDSAPWWSCD